MNDFEVEVCLPVGCDHVDGTSTVQRWILSNFTN